MDTSLPDVSIALLKDGKLLSKIHNNVEGEHSIYVTKYIDDILKKHNISPKDVDEIIIVNGPGSFTGIRIGVTIAKTYAYLVEKRIVPITSLLARALGTSAKYILSLIDAKHGNYYIGLYDDKHQKIIEKFASQNEIEEIKEKYSPILIDSSLEYDYEKIISYTKNLPSVNPHSVNPIYLKLPEAMEKR